MKQVLVILMAIIFLVGVTVSTGWTQAGSDVKTQQKTKMDEAQVKRNADMGQKKAGYDLKKPTQPAGKSQGDKQPVK